MNDFKELKVWQKAIGLFAVVYEITLMFLKDEIYGLISQTRRAVVSILSDIAEGVGRVSKGNSSHFLNIARGSSFELETQLRISYNLNYLKKSDFDCLTKDFDEIQRMITGLQKS